MIKVKRAYDAREPSDGVRILVDRLWPRGLTKEKAAVDEWLKDIAPTSVLRRWYGHDPARWDEFRVRYRNELAAAGMDAELARLRRLAARGTVTFLFSSKERERNNAVALKGFIGKEGDRCRS